MADTTFDTLRASRDLKAAGIEDQHATAIVNAIRQSVGRSVTVDRFDAGIAELRARVDTGLTELRAHIDTGLTELRAHVDSGLTELRAENARALLIYTGVIIGANALVVTIAGMVLAASLSA